MKLFVNKLAEKYAKQLCTWKYKGENMSQDMTYKYSYLGYNSVVEM